MSFFKETVNFPYICFNYDFLDIIYNFSEVFSNSNAKRDSFF